MPNGSKLEVETISKWPKCLCDGDNKKKNAFSEKNLAEKLLFVIGALSLEQPDRWSGMGGDPLFRIYRNGENLMHDDSFPCAAFTNKRRLQESCFKGELVTKLNVRQMILGAKWITQRQGLQRSYSWSLYLKHTHATVPPGTQQNTINFSVKKSQTRLAR